ncbi:Leucine rich repeat [Popillia japonica]|uniref:Leucine rich repeat n=1 Tax=Popillia japonica TaxID=7064 RepID=A0AAW1JW10_POPJA
MSITSSTSAISKTQSFGLPAKRDKLDKAKRLIEECFHEVYAANCQEADLTDYPTMKVMYAEPVSWVCAAQAQAQAQAQQERRASKTTITRATTSMASAAQRRSSSDSRKTQSTYVMKGQQYPSKKYEIYAIYNDPDRDGSIDALIYSHFPLEDEVMGVLQKTMLQFWSLKLLKWFDQLKALKWILIYYILLRNTILTSLSLRYCQIDSEGATKIAAYLQYPSMLTLTALDLSCNFIADAGCNAIADALRTNRTLTHIALTSNQITNVGCIELMRVLQKFPLTHQEILIKRKLNMDYLLRCKVGRAHSTPVIPTASRIPIPPPTVVRPPERPRSFPKRSFHGKSKKGISPERLSGSSIASSRKPKINMPKKLAPVLSPISIILKDPHPFMHECVHENKQVFCLGNFTLQYLSLAYNNINCMEVNDIKGMLSYQSSVKCGTRSPFGAVKLILDGNPILKCVDAKELGLMTTMSMTSICSKATKRSQTR